MYHISAIAFYIMKRQTRNASFTRHGDLGRRCAPSWASLLLRARRFFRERFARRGFGVRQGLASSKSGHRLGEFGACAAPSGEIHAFAFTPDGRQLLYGGEDKTAALCDIDSPGAGPLLRRPRRGNQGGGVLGRHPARCCQGMKEGNAEALEKRPPGRLLRSFRGNGSQTNSVAFTPDGRRALAGTGSKTGRVSGDIADGQGTQRHSGCSSAP